MISKKNRISRRDFPVLLKIVARDGFLLLKEAKNNKNYDRVAVVVSAKNCPSSVLRHRIKRIIFIDFKDSFRGRDLVWFVSPLRGTSPSEAIEKITLSLREIREKTRKW